MRAALTQLVLRLFSLLPLSAAHAAGAGLGWLAWVVPNGLRRVALTNLALCWPQQDPARRRALARRSFMEMGKTVAEMGAMWYWSAARLRGKIRDVVGWENIEAARARGKGVIALTPHLGAWELTSQYYVSRHPLTCLYRPPRLKALDAMIRRSRQRMGAHLVPTTPSGVKTLYQTLEQGETVGILPDQDPGRGAGVFAAFFGVPANTMTLVPRLVQTTGAAVVFVYAERLPRGRGYVMHFLPAPDGVDDPDPVVAAAAMNRGVECCVRECPTQYLWAYKRFKTRPEGEAGVYG